jgi:hypothetical protein
VPWNDEALAAGREDDPPEAARPADADGVGEATCAAGVGVGAGGCRVRAVAAKAAAEAAIRKPMIHASASGRHLRRRGRFRPPAGGAASEVSAAASSWLAPVAAGGWRAPVTAGGWLAPVAAGTGALPAVVRVTGSLYPAVTAESRAASRPNARMTESGRQVAAGARAPTSASRPAAVGRWLGSLARQRSISGRRPAGT